MTDNDRTDPRIEAVAQYLEDNDQTITYWAAYLTIAEEALAVADAISGSAVRELATAQANHDRQFRVLDATIRTLENSNRRLEGELATLKQRILAIHRENLRSYGPRTCFECMDDWPCTTVRALDASFVPVSVESGPRN